MWPVYLCSASGLVISWLFAATVKTVHDSASGWAVSSVTALTRTQNTQTKSWRDLQCVCRAVVCCRSRHNLTYGVACKFVMCAFYPYYKKLCLLEVDDLQVRTLLVILHFRRSREE